MRHAPAGRHGLTGWWVDRVLPGLITSALWVPVGTLALWLSHRKLRRHITKTADQQTAELRHEPPEGTS